VPPPDLNLSLFKGQTIAQARRSLSTLLSEAGFEVPHIEARRLLEMASGLSHSDLIIKSDRVLSPEFEAKLMDFLSRRLSGEPLDHMQGYKAFYGRDFIINRDVLSPRPETEEVVRLALEHLKLCKIEDPKEPLRILDLGTGSGAILISIVLECDQAVGIGVDISEAALNVAKQNARKFAVSGAVSLVKSHWFENVNGVFNVIVANPPYISQADMDELGVEVKTYDPHIALSGGVDGLEAYVEIIRNVRPYLKLKGRLIVEIGHDQAAAVKTMMLQAGLVNVNISQDLSGLDRIVSGSQDR